MTEKQKKKSKKKTEKKRIATQSKDTDNEWVTESEKAINELSIGSQESILNDERIKLFEDPCTPEKTRDKLNTYEEILSKSPIIQSSRNRLHLISKKHDVILQDELLPVNLLPTEIQNPEESNEDETIFRTLNRIFVENSCRNSIIQYTITPLILFKFLFNFAQ